MEITAIATQTVAPLNNVLFTNTAVASSNCSILHRSGSGLVTVRGVGNQCRARYKVFFSGNLGVPSGGTVGSVSLALTANGEPLGEGTMTVTPAAVLEYSNIATQVYIDVPHGCCVQVAVRNIGSTDVSVQNANLIVERVA